MSDGRIVITSEPSLSPGEIASRTFATSFRGYDQGEVRHYLERVASELTSAIDRESELKAQIDALRHQAAHPELDEETLTNALGEEAASILRSAREAASDIRAKAEQNVARLSVWHPDRVVPRRVPRGALAAAGSAVALLGIVVALGPRLVPPPPVVGAERPPGGIELLISCPRLA